MNKENRLLFFSFLFCIISTSLVVVTFGYYFDISDEGLAAYLSLFGREAVWAQQFHYANNVWGDFWGHSLLTYRWLYLVLVYLECFVFSYAVCVYYNIPLYKDKFRTFFTVFFCSVSAQLVFVVFTTPSYNSYAAFSGFLWASMFLFILSEADIKCKNIAVMLLASISVLTAFMAKSSTGVALLLGLIFLIPCFCFISKRKLLSKSVCCAYLGGLFGIILYYLVLGGNLNDVVAAYGAYGSSGVFSLPKLLLKHLRDVIILTAYSSVYLAVWFILLRVLKRDDAMGKLLSCLIFIGLLVFSFAKVRPLPAEFYQFDLLGFSIDKFIPSTVDYPKSKMITFLLSLSLVVLFLGDSFIKDFKGCRRKDFLFFLIVIFASLGVYAGTTANLSWHMRSVAGLVIAVPVVFYALRLSSSDYGVKLVGVSLLAFAVLGIHHQYNNVLANYYRCPPLETQNSVSSSSRLLKGVSIDPERAAIIDNMAMVLNELKFNRDQDRIYVFPAAPGFLAALNVQAYGPLWSTKHVVDVDCFYFSIEKELPDSKIYILRGGDVPLATKSCFLSKLRPSPEYKSVPLGEYYNYRQDKKLAYCLEGPYVPF